MTQLTGCPVPLPACHVVSLTLSPLLLSSLMFMETLASNNQAFLVPARASLSGTDFPHTALHYAKREMGSYIIQFLGFYCTWAHPICSIVLQLLKPDCKGISHLRFFPNTNSSDAEYFLISMSWTIGKATVCMLNCELFLPLY